MVEENTYREEDIKVRAEEGFVVVRLGNREIYLTTDETQKLQILLEICTDVVTSRDAAVVH